jgi:hypothetical protein
VKAVAAAAAAAGTTGNITADKAAAAMQEAMGEQQQQKDVAGTDPFWRCFFFSDVGTFETGLGRLAYGRCVGRELGELSSD